MKKALLLLSFIIGCTLVIAQAPDGFKYQAVVRNATGDPITDQNVRFRISILEGSSSGTPVFQETHLLQTNTFGLANINIGSGTASIGTLGGVSWGTNDYFLKVEVDPNAGTTYTLLGTSQLLSVPYAKHATSAAGFPKMTTAERDALPLVEGTVIYNTDDLKFQGVGGVQEETESLDQAVVPRITTSTTLNTSTSTLGNSFTANKNGSLTSIEFYVNSVIAPGFVQLRLYKGNGTGGQVLTTSENHQFTLGINKVDFITPVDIKPGEEYTWEIQYLSGSLGLAQSSYAYWGGNAYQNTFNMSYDFYFKTYVKQFSIDWADLN